MEYNVCGFVDTPGLIKGCGSGVAMFMTMVELVLRSRCDISDPCNRAGRDNLQLRDEYDFIVVGSGVAGSLLASHLSKHPNERVLLLEAGPEEPTLTQLPTYAITGVGSPVDWNYTTVAQQRACLSSGGICKWPRGKMISGTFGLNGMMYSRGHRSIFDNWALAGNEGWDYDSVLPYFKHSENNKEVEDTDEGYHGSHGTLTVQQFPHRTPMAESIIEAGIELGYRRGDLNGANQTGINIAPMMLSDGLRGSTSRVYLRPAAKRENLQVSINSHVTRIIVENGQAKGVEFVDKDGKARVVLAKKEVILSAGAIGSPQLLLLSGIGPKEDLEALDILVKNDLPVGKNLHNHVSTSVGFMSNDTSYTLLTQDTFNQFLDHRNGPMASTGLTQATGFFLSKYATNQVPDLQIFFDGDKAACSQTGRSGECLDGTVGSCGKKYVNIRPTNILTQSVGSLKLKSKNPFDYPLLDPNYFEKQIDIDILVEGIRLAIKMSETEALKRWGFEVVKTPVEGCSSFEWGSDAYWECHVTRHTGPENHQSGTCKMGPSSATSVVDPQLRVHGVTNLRVIDASIFPYSPNGNPTSVIIMTAEKGYDMIKNTWGL